MSLGAKTGIKYGIIGAVIYMMLLTIRYNWMGNNYFFHAILQAASLLIIVLIAAMAGLETRKKLGGYASLKQVFQPIFITLLISELFYCIFYYAYMNFIDPGYYDRYIPYVTNWMKNNNINKVNPEKFKETIDGLTSQKLNKSQIKPLFSVLFQSIILDGMLGMLTALVIRNKSSMEVEEMTRIRMEQQQKRQMAKSEK